MRKMLNTLFVTSEDIFLALEGENVLAKRSGEVAARYPLHTLDSIYSFSYQGASPSLMGACAEHNILLSFMTPRGRFLARVCGLSNGNVLLRREQYRIADDTDYSVNYASSFITGKLYNCRWILERGIRDHALRINVDEMKQISNQIKMLTEKCCRCDDAAELRGIEGKAAVMYFDGFNRLILQNNDVFRMNSRSRRPPLDPANALLSFLYTLLANDCGSALEAAGLDSYVGFMHRDRPGRPSLALDLMEELRPVMADRMALTLINNRQLSGKHFRMEGTGGVFLSDDGRKIVLSAWRKRKEEQIKHPFLGEKLPWGLVPYVQALLLSRSIRGDLDGYPPFLWK